MSHRHKNDPLEDDGLSFPTRSQHQRYVPDKSPPLDEAAHIATFDSSYPPLRSQTMVWSTSSPSSSLFPDATELPSFTKPSASRTHLETIGTDDGSERPMNSSVELKLSEIESGWRAALWPASKFCRAYLITVMVETVIDIAIEGTILQQLNTLQETTQVKTSLTTNQTQQPIYLGIFVLAHVLQMVLAIDAVYNKNTLQFLFLAFFNFMLLIYGAMQIVEVQGNIDIFVNQQGATSPSLPVHALIIIVPVVIAVAEVAYIALGYQIWRDFGWKVYKFLGADRSIKKIYAQYQVFQCLLKFDIFFWVGFSIQWMGLVSLGRFEFYATVAALPLSILLLIEGYMAARHENKWMMGSFMLGCAVGCAYFVYKAWRIFTDKDLTQFRHLWKTLLVFACVSIVLLLLTFISATIIMLNFDRGLKENMNKKAKQRKLERWTTTHKGGLRGSDHPPIDLSIKRMSIE